MTDAKLAELSAKATQGEWKEAMFSDGLCIYTEREPGVLGERVMKLFRWLGDSPTREKNIEFVTALVNAYRSGKLREVGDGEVVVPMEPTEAMLYATLGCWTTENGGHEACAKDMWKAMLAAKDAP